MLTLTDADSQADRAIEARGLDVDGRPGAWVPVEVVFDEDELRVVRAELGMDASEAQIRVRQDGAPELALLTWTAVTPAHEGEVEDARADDAVDSPVASTSRGLAGDLASAGILPRSAWGARAARCRQGEGPKQRMAVHHTASARTSGGTFEGMLRQTQAFHMDGRGYCDVGYHFFVTADGRAWEAREVDSVGGHSGNYNGRNAGIVFVGCFDGSAACNNLGGRDVPQAMMAAGARVIRALSDRYGIPIDGDRIKGHGQQPYQQTACPGSHLRGRLDELRGLARGGGGTVAPPVDPQPTQPAPGLTAASGCGALGVNVFLARGQSIDSCGARYRLAHQGDGNVVLYNVGSGRAVWSTGTNGRATEIFVMQADGNVVLYGGGRALWSSGTSGRSGATLAVQDDGNLVVYAPGNRAVWASNTAGAGGGSPPAQPPPPPPPPPPAASCGALGVNVALARGEGLRSCSGRYHLAHQGDGNVVLYDDGAGSRVLWTTATAGRATSQLVMQGDGNLVLYSGARALWSSGTVGRAGATLAVQDDGNVVIYAPGNRAVWSTGTNRR